MDCEEVEDIKTNKVQQLLVLKCVIVHLNSNVFQIGWIVKVMYGIQNYELDILYIILI